MSGSVSVVASCGRCKSPMAPVHGTGSLVASCLLCGADWVVDVRLESASWVVDVRLESTSVGRPLERHGSVQAIEDLLSERPWLGTACGRKIVPVGCEPTAEQWRQIRAA